MWPQAWTWLGGERMKKRLTYDTDTERSGIRWTELSDGERAAC